MPASSFVHNSPAHKSHLFKDRHAEVRKRVEAHLETNPNGRIAVDSFSHFLGHPEGTKLVGKERTRIRLALNDMATKIAKKKGLIRKLPIGGPVTNLIRNEMFKELLAEIRKSPNIEPDANYYYKKYFQKLCPQEKYAYFSQTISEMKLVAKKRLKKEEPRIVFWDAAGKPKKRINSFYVRAGADKKIEELIKRSPNAQINVDEFTPLLGYPAGKKLVGYERNKVRITLATMARRIAKELGIKRNPPSGGARQKRTKSVI